MADILVLDDERTVRDLCVSRLGDRLGHNVEPAASAEEAWALLASRSFDVAIVDLVLVNAQLREGMDFIRQLRGMPEHKYTQVVIVTAYGEIETARGAIRLGVSDYVVKQSGKVADELEWSVGQALLRQRMIRCLGANITATRLLLRASEGKDPRELENAMHAAQASIAEAEALMDGIFD